MRDEVSEGNVKKISSEPDTAATTAAAAATTTTTTAAIPKQQTPANNGGCLPTFERGGGAGELMRGLVQGPLPLRCDALRFAKLGSQARARLGGRSHAPPAPTVSQ